MYKRILVPVDGSEMSRKAGYEAVKLAKELNSTIIVTHIADQKSTIPYDELEARGRKYIDKIRDYATENNVESEDILIYGSPKNDIRIIARKSQADLIILGTHGATGLTSMLLGSFAQFVIKNIDLPVMLIK